MTTHSRLYWAASDSLVMIGRSLRHTVRSVDTLLLGAILPTMLMLMFVHIFGGAINTGTAYVTYVVPGVILLCAGYGSANTAVAVAADMANGIVDRFRSLPILSSAVLTGHVVASVARNLFATVLVLVVAFASGFRPTAGPLEWLAATGLLVLFMLAMSWVSVFLGMLAGSVESASAFTFVVLFLPYLSSGFVPTDTMPGFLRGFAEHQPITPMIEALRGLLTDVPVDDPVPAALAWFGGLLVFGYVAASVLFRRRRPR
ncbi:ABC transporter permease [Polymorphospora rubra]|uniref:ABC transporter permease n=1 Tax=Polymorphospora rubra TaxID=338584 RepID=UPI0033C6D6D1